MKTTVAVKLVPITPAETLVQKVVPLGKVLASVRSKIREDLFRFRTCCADPRASK